MSSDQFSTSNKKASKPLHFSETDQEGEKTFASVDDIRNSSDQSHEQHKVIAINDLNDSEQTVLSVTPPLEVPITTIDHAQEDDVPFSFTIGETLPPGTELAHFTITKYIGGGGMGRVYLGIDKALDRKVAIKVLPVQRVHDQASVARFMNEAKSAARLNHEHIAQVYFAGEYKGVPFIAFEYVQGTNVRTYVEQYGVFPLPQAINYLLQISHALTHAETHHVIHRDVKPSNILITSGARAKLIDMGLARLLSQSKNDDLTASGVTLGTFDYISPEQARDPRNADIRSDIYSLGCTFYYMLTGRPPFSEGTVLQKLLQHQGDAPPDVRELQPDVPVQVSQIIQKMMAKDPRNRYQSPAELVDDLTEIAKMLGLRPVDSGNMVWSLPIKTRYSYFFRHLPWLLPMLILILVFIMMQSGLILSSKPDGTSTNLPDIPAQPVINTGTNSAPIKNGTGASQETVITHQDGNQGKAMPIIPTPPSQANNISEVTRAWASNFVTLLGTVHTFSDTPPASQRTLQFVDNHKSSSIEKTTGGTNTEVGVTPSALVSTAICPPVFATGLGVSFHHENQVYQLFNVTSSELKVARFNVKNNVGNIPKVEVIKEPTMLIVDPTGSLTNSYKTVQEAVRAAAKKAEIVFYTSDTLEIGHIDFSGTSLHLKAAPGYKPKISFRPNAQTIISTSCVQLVDAQLVFDHIDFEMEIPQSSNVLADRWTMFGLVGLSNIELTNVTMTIKNAQADRAYHENVAFFRSSSRSNMIIPSPGGGSPAFGPLDRLNIQLNNVVMRGEASIVRCDVPCGLGFNATNVLIASSQPVFVLQDVKLSTRNSDLIKALFKHCTLFAPLIVSWQQGGSLDVIGHPMQLTLEDSIVRLSKRSFLAEYAGSISRPVDVSSFYKRVASHTFYENLTNEWVVRPSRAGEIPFEERMALSGEDVRIFLDTLVWKKPLISGQAIHQLSVDHFALDENVSSNLAVGGASDKTNAGAIIPQLPKP